MGWTAHGSGPLDNSEGVQLEANFSAVSRGFEGLVSQQASAVSALQGHKGARARQGLSEEQRPKSCEGPTSSWAGTNRGSLPGTISGPCRGAGRPGPGPEGRAGSQLQGRRGSGAGRPAGRAENVFSACRILSFTLLSLRESKITLRFIYCINSAGVLIY